MQIDLKREFKRKSQKLNIQIFEGKEDYVLLKILDEYLVYKIRFFRIETFFQYPLGVTDLQEYMTDSVITSVYCSGSVDCWYEKEIIFIGNFDDCEHEKILKKCEK